MADKKISALTSASTPLAGTEVLPIVQGGATVKVAVSDLTAGRAISATQLTLTTGNLIVASGQGIDFSATSHLAGMTSELLADYEEGTWTPTITAGSGTITSYTLTAANYTKIGRAVHINVIFTITNAGTGASSLVIPMPFTNGAAIANGTGRENSLTGSQLQIQLNATTASADLFNYNNTTAIGTNATIRATMTYFV